MYGLEALECFYKMQLTSFILYLITIVSILILCANFEALKWGMYIHKKIIRYKFLSYAIMIKILMYMYAKCRSIKMENILFDKMHYE